MPRNSNSEILDNIINAEDIDPDSHDGSYELVRETIKSLSKIDKDNLDIKDLNLLYGMAIGSWKLNFKAKSERIYNSNLSDYEKSRLDNVLKKIEDKARNSKYSNRKDGKDTSVGMFGTGFYVFDNNSTKEEANKFLNLCINIKDMEDEDEIFNLSEAKFKDGIRGIQSSSASIMLHCFKPTVFPILTGAYIEKLPILKTVGLNLEKANLLTTYIKNARKIRGFRDESCNFKNYRVLDIELLDFKDSNIKKKENLNDFLQIEKHDLVNYKIKLNIKNPSGTEPIDVMIKDDKARHRWMGWKFNDNELSRDYVIGLAREYRLGQKFWRFIGVFKILERYQDVTEDIGYRLEELDEYNKFKDTLLLKYKNKSQNLFRNAETFIEELKVIEEPIDHIDIEPEGLEEKVIEPYAKEQFLEEVYMTEERLDTLLSLLENKQNLILQGAPGVGKTFASKRLAYTMMKEKDEDRIKFIQFHQNYSYEDFIMGYRPDGEGFKLQYGVFYRFCQKALNMPNKPYFFIIDEINRGNMSKIFGELLMLIEKDYRGTNATLAYNGMPFSVPKNIYIIGMMNTADRSLAMIDYALRRRFSFFDIEPEFKSEGFKKYQASLDNDIFNDLIEKINELNKEIAVDGSLGKGFRIGHSYFCGKKECTDDWMMEIVEYDILPMLSEYWFDEPTIFKRWENILYGVLNDK